MATAELSPRRVQALALLNRYLPCETGSAHFSEISKDFGGIGTTCGYLTAWLLWRLGCRDPRIVNREEPSDGLHYAVGMNIARLVQGGKTLGAWRTLSQGIRPRPGDCCYWAKDPPDIVDGAKNFREHVNVAIDCEGDLFWKTADAGRTNASGEQMAEFVERPYQAAVGSAVFVNGSRKLIGWVDIDALTMIPGVGLGPDSDSTDDVVFAAICLGTLLSYAAHLKQSRARG